MTAEPETTTESSAELNSKIGWFVSLTFWSFILFATTLFAAVMLAPKYLTHINLTVERYDNQVQLLTLERHTQYLNRIGDAFKHDPHFAEEFARAQFHVGKTGDEHILLEENLHFDVSLLEPIEELPQATTPWFTPYLFSIAEEKNTRLSMLSTAAFVLLFAFVFLQESSVVKLRSTVEVMGNCLSWVTNRYSQPDETSEQ